MVRKCRLKSCKRELPKTKDCTDIVQKKGFCGYDCLTEYGRIKAHEQRERKARQKKRSIKDNDKSHQQELTRISCNKMVRLLDEGKECISCGRNQCGSSWHAGHFRSVAAAPEIRFDPRNIHLQGSGCNLSNRRPDKNNTRKAETIAQEYEERLRERYGDDLVDWVKGPHEMPHWSCEELMALRKVFNRECRRLEAGKGPSRDWRALDYTLRELIEEE